MARLGGTELNGAGRARIALVDDDRITLMALGRMLEADGFAVETHADSTAALAALSLRPPDLAVLDISMPGLDGFALLRGLRRVSDVPVVFLTGRDDEIDEVQGLALGADDYLRKPVSPRLLAARLRAVLRRPPLRGQGQNGQGQNGRGPSPPPDLLERGPLVMDAARHAVRWAGAPVALTGTEFRVLAALARSPGTVLGRTALQAAAYGPAIHVHARTIDSHVKRLRAKLRAADPGFAAIETVHGLGYRFKGTPVPAPAPATVPASGPTPEPTPGPASGPTSGPVPASALAPAPAPSPAPAPGRPPAP